MHFYSGQTMHFYSGVDRGWADGYTNAIPRLLQGLKTPRKGLIGPWAHLYPHIEKLHPMGFIQEILRWWDRWLKGEANGIENEPMVHAWIENSAPPAEIGVSGHWVVEPSWPAPSVAPRRFYPELFIEEIIKLLNRLDNVGLVMVAS